MNIQEVMRLRCEAERDDVHSAFALYTQEVNEITREYGQLLRETQQSVDSLAANKFRLDINKLFAHGTK
jgi:hypothetical protein